VKKGILLGDALETALVDSHCQRHPTRGIAI
jgi:hypothetical protein